MAQADDRAFRGPRRVPGVAPEQVEWAERTGEPLVGRHAIVSDDVVLGRGVTIMPGVYVGRGTVLGDDVTIAPNAALVASPDAAGRELTGIVVEDGASIGANATVLAGLTIGRGAVVAPGAVVTLDVPPGARVDGSPARITGYVSSSSPEPTRVLRASALEAAELPVPLGRASLIGMPVIADLRGVLTFAEVGGLLPFPVERFFFVHSVPSRRVRGEHAHRACHEFIVCLQGSCEVVTDDGSERAEVVLDRPEVGLHLPPMVWVALSEFTPETIVLVLTSHRYDDGDYIRDYDEYRRTVAGG